MHRVHYRKNFDPLLVFLPLIICGIGFIFLYSASRGMQQIKGIDFMVRQMTWVLIGFFAFIIVSTIDFKRILDGAYFYYIFISLILFVLLLVGGEKMGARRWLSLGLLNFQPSEFAKLFLILALAFFLGNNRYSPGSLRVFLVPILMTSVLFVLILKEPDLGSAIALLPILFSILLVANVPLKFLFGSITAGMIASPLFWNLLRGYQKRRLLVFLNPNMDPLGAGYTVIQSKIAIGSGGLFGKGWMSGTQNQLNFLPERHTDFIFSVAGEEWGFAGSLVVVSLYCWLISRILSVAERTNDLHGRLLVVGVAALLSFQVIVNIAMTAGLMPVVGLPLPLISYGGSSAIVTWICLALVANVDINRTIF